MRDFLLLFFFVGLGARLDLSLLGAQVPAALVLSFFVLVGNPLIVMMIMGALGYRKRTGLLAGLTIAQISEFSLIFMAMGLSLKHVDEEAIGLVTLVGLVTITMSTYMILYSHQIYRVLDPYLDVFEKRVPQRELANVESGGQARYDVILFGLGRYGHEIWKHLQNHGLTVLGIDFDPETVRRTRQRNLPAVYGDATDPEFAASLPLGHVSWVIVAIPPVTPGVAHLDARLALIDGVRRADFSGRIAVRAQDGLDMRRLRQAKVDVVLAPFSDAAERAVGMLREFDEGRLKGSPRTDALSMPVP